MQVRLAFSAVAKGALKVPIHLYRWTLKPFVGWHCRHQPSCSEYALGAIDRNGAWRGFWLVTARLTRCHPWGTHGYDPVPDIRDQHDVLTPWRYGRWSWSGELGLPADGDEDKMSRTPGARAQASSDRCKQ